MEKGALQRCTRLFLFNAGTIFYSPTFVSLKKSIMASFDMSIPHSLSQDEALKRIQQVLAQLKAEHGDKISNLHEEWNGYTGKFSLTAMSFDISGTLTVHPSTVDLDAELPFAASLFKGTIKSLISQKAEALLKP